MAPKKKAKAPTSKKPVVRKDGLPTRLEKKAVNKVIAESARQIVHVTIQEQKQAGKFAASPSIADIIGKPMEWSTELGEALFALISTGHGMDSISKMDGMPSLYLMLKWLSESTHPFSLCHARAKEMLVPFYEEKAQQIGVNTNVLVLKTRKQVVTKDGEVRWVTERKEIDNVARSQLAVQTLQWTLGHLKPRKHGRAPEPATVGANEQLKGLIDALKAGPVDTPTSKK